MKKKRLNNIKKNKKKIKKKQEKKQNAEELKKRIFLKNWKFFR